MDLTINDLLERNESGRNTNGHATADRHYKEIGEKLEQITRFLEKEIAFKQCILEEQRAEIEKLKTELGQKTTTISNLEQQLQQSMQNTEGHRQLINKLLNDIEHYQNDIEWYRRTYERRSILGLVKQKLLQKH